MAGDDDASTLYAAGIEFAPDNFGGSIMNYIVVAIGLNVGNRILFIVGYS